MSTEKRLALFVVLALVSFWGTEFLMGRLGLLPKPEPKEVAARKAADSAAAKEPAKADSKGEPAKAEAKPTEPKKDGEKADEPKTAGPEIKLFEPQDLQLGSLDKASGYHLALQVDQKGGGVGWLRSSLYEAERTSRRKVKQPLTLLREDRTAPPSFSMTLRPADGAKVAGLDLDYRVWEVVPGEDGRAVRRIMMGKEEVGQRIVLRAPVGEPPVVVTRTYTLNKGEDGLDLELAFEGGGDRPRKVAYELMGPHGIPIEGDWYTSTFRDIFVEQAGGGGIKTDTAYNVARAGDKQEHYQSYPLAFAGVENQYFAVFLATDPSSWTPEKRWDKETVPTVIHEDKEDPQKADVSIVLTSKEFEVGPNLSATHRYHVFAGPKIPDVLPKYAEELASFRKGWSMLGLGWLGRQVAQSIITPLLGSIYKVTQSVAGLFGARQGNWGVAIILLVITVRLILFPISRKQAIMAKKMQDLQPHLAELKEKYKDDKERQMKETFALQRKHGVNMFGGCLPALIQVPIFMGLWQALNNSVALRHAGFLWIRDLSAPDMLFRWPFDMMEVPFVGRWIGPYFNILPLVSACLMLAHTKLFSPPPTTPEAEMQQSMMKYMMVFMALMLYKVPSGLGIYFITSSSWAICERLLLPKTIKIRPIEDSDDKGGGGRGGPGGGGRGGPDGNGKGGGWFARKLEQLMEEASKDPTIRNKLDKARERAGEPERERTSPQRPPRPKSRPGKRR